MRQMFLQPTASVELELESSECALNWQRCCGFLGISDMKKEEVHMVSKTGGDSLEDAAVTDVSDFDDSVVEE